ncbi:quinone oxidoreductase family protein [Nocardia altamirensis]|uniref:quinone oxidoreductase family protein n=1 Tax=Nocardia altamirensis TaxID=472158 RepID=UPI0008408F17|nr:NADPH:quinone oxidoreductase family protein [Nocardia altamirensis]
MRAIQVSTLGGPEVLSVVDVPNPVAGPSEQIVRVTAAGINYADTHMTENTYLSRTTLPFIPGGEIVGRTAAGERILALVPGGGYAEQAVVADGSAVEVPDAVSDGQALALLIQGLSAWHLLHTSAKLAPGESVVINAAAGGVGSLAVQLAKYFGAGRVIATASTPEKRQLALDLGADIAVDNAAEGYAERIREANDGKRIDIVLDAMSGPVLDAALTVLAQFGRLVTYGMASREPATPINPGDLLTRNLSVIGFWVTPALAMRGMFHEPLVEMLDLTAAGKLRPIVGGAYPLAEARRAHEDLLARRTTGKLILTPN